MLYWTWNDPSSVQGSSIQEMSLVAEWVRQLEFKSIDVSSIQSGGNFIFADYDTPRCQFCTKMPEKSDLCYLGKTRMENEQSQIKIQWRNGLTFTQDVSYYGRTGKRFQVKDIDVISAFTVCTRHYTLVTYNKNIKEWRISLWWLVCKIVALSY